VLTVNAVLSVAATMADYRVLSYDQTGAAQKWGPVLSSVVLAPQHMPVHSNKVGMGRADLYLALDIVGGSTPVNLDRCSPDRTSAVLNTDLFPTGEQVRDVYTQVDEAGMLEAITVRCRAAVAVPARSIAENIFGDYMLTNVVALGAAYQAGLLPLSADSIERAIELNGVAVTANLQAFRYGRLWMHDRPRVQAALAPPELSADDAYADHREHLGTRRQAACDQLWQRTEGLSEQTRRLLAVRLAELVDYQHERYAQRYLDDVLAVARREQETVAGDHRLTDAVARNLYKLMAYKDEYEVARLFLKPRFGAEITATFAEPTRVVNHLQPPLARRLGRNRKIAVGPWFRPAFRVLRMARRLRATPLDPFARQASRVEERTLIDWYQALLADVLTELRPANHAVAIELAGLPDGIRGYEQVKHAGAEAAKAKAAELAEQLRKPRLPLLAS
jgi:indolepyruvate ferredoxin oxidoreductase